MGTSVCEGVCVEEHPSVWGHPCVGTSVCGDIRVRGHPCAWVSESVEGQGTVPALFVTPRTRGVIGGSGSWGTCPGNSSSVFPQGAVSRGVSHWGGGTNRCLSPCWDTRQGVLPGGSAGGRRLNMSSRLFLGVCDDTLGPGRGRKCPRAPSRPGHFDPDVPKAGWDVLRPWG